IACLRCGCGGVAAEEGELLNDRTPACVDEAEAGVVGDEHEIESGGRGVGEWDRSEADLPIAVGPDDDGVEIAEVVVEGKMFEGQNGRVVVVANDLLLIAISDGDEEFGGNGKGIAGSIEDAQVQRAQEFTSRRELRGSW